jgi:hypothetical protein
LNLLRERKQPILIQFEENTDIWIKNPQIENIDLVPPIVFMNDIIPKEYILNNIQYSYSISYKIADMTNILLSLCVCNGTANISLDSNGLLEFQNSSEVGSVSISKQLKKNGANEYGDVNLKIIIKFVKAFIAAAASNKNDMDKKCIFELPSGNDGYVKIHFNMCTDANGYIAFALCK